MPSPTPAKRLAPRPPSPTGSVSSVRTSKFDLPEVTIDEVREYLDRPHHSWGSAMKEMARVETQAQLAKDKRRRLEEMSETGSCVSGISAYTGKSNATIRSSVSAPARPVKGRMGMLPLGARATSAHGREQPPSPTGSVQSAFSVNGSTVAVDRSVQRHTRGSVGGGSVGGGSAAVRAAGPAGGRSGPRRRSDASDVSGVSHPSFAPTAVGLNKSPVPPPPAAAGGKFSFVAPASQSGTTLPPNGFVPKFKPRSTTTQR
jgi:hypothetical protein